MLFCSTNLALTWTG